MSQSPARAPSGELMLGRYRPIRPLGSGGSGSVWLVREDSRGRDVALKMVRREGPAGPRAEREATTAARLRHERCLQAYALARDPGHVYIAYEYVPGRTFREAMREGDLEDRDTLEAGAQIAEGLAHAHANGVVHRDVKPANVLLADGPEVSVKLLDFGLALMREEETLTAVGDIPGTLAYISPERLRGEQAGPPADIWSLGVLLWEALAGRHPFWSGNLLETARAIQAGPPSLATVRPDLPKQVVSLIDRMLSVQPRRRPRAGRLAGDLRRSGAARPRRRTHAPTLSVGRLRAPALAGIVPALSAALFAGWTAAALPFYPGGWWALLAVAALLLSLRSPLGGAAFALAVPVFPLGNHAFGLAVLYGLVAAGWLAICRGEARSTFFFLLGPLLAPFGAIGLLPLAAQIVRSPWRRMLQTVAAVLAAGAVAGLSRLGSLGVAETNGPLASAAGLVDALDTHRIYLLLAALLAGAAVALPWTRAHGVWALAALGASVTALAVVGGGLKALPVVACIWTTCALLAAEPTLRQRLAQQARHGSERAVREGQRGESTAAQGRERLGTVPAEA
jgi:Protein kinase domain